MIVHRLPRRDNASSQASGGPIREPVPRAIIAKFVYMRDRDKVLAAFEATGIQRRPIPGIPENYGPHGPPACPESQKELSRENRLRTQKGKKGIYKNIRSWN